MKSKLEINKKISQIGEETFDKLKELDIAPYPKYYLDTFMDILAINNDAQLSDMSEKYSSLFCNYKKNGSQKDEPLDVARMCVEIFEKSNGKIQKISSENIEELNRVNKLTGKEKEEKLSSICNGLRIKMVDEFKAIEKQMTQIRLKLESLEKQLNINEITKLPNHIVYENDIKKILVFGKERDLDSYVILLNADNFQNINAKFGHVAGDKTLIYISNLLKNSLRAGTKIYHVNGDEFCILLNRAHEKEAVNVTKRILKEIEQSKLFYKGNNIHLTFSAGVIAHKKNDTFDSFNDRAKRVLELAKKEKNCFKEEV